MPVKRGDVILAYVPNVDSAGGKVRPALIVQSDHSNARLTLDGKVPGPFLRHFSARLEGF
jgi:mRNA-degrading endonuclease toxin of MazEF toxin-antitoxin module